MRLFALQYGERSVQPGDRVALISESRPEWVISDLAILTAGAITVPVYPTQSPAQVRYILQDAGAKGIDFEFGKGPRQGGPLWDPDYLDPVFLAKLEKFLTDLNSHVSVDNKEINGLKGPHIIFTGVNVPSKAFGEFVDKNVRMYMNGELPPDAILSAVMNITDDVVAGREPILRAGDYIALQTAFKGK